MRLLTILLLFTLLLTPLFAQPLFAQKDKPPVSDDVIVDQVRVRIADDSEVGGQPIQVDAHKGVVVLTGKITNDKLKSRVEKLARKVKGVTGVDDKLVVSPY
jgi:osmotically-inducible protein OsmY